jgi:cytochrome P450
MMSTHAEGSDLAAATGIYLTDVRAKREPYDLLARLREEDPVHLSAAGTWIISGYDLALSVLRDTRFSRAAATEREIELLFEPSDAAEIYWHKTVNREGDDHSRLRRILAPAFSPRAVERWRPFIEKIVDKVFDELEPRHQCDIVTDLAYPIPEHVICTMLGVPPEHHNLFEQWTRVLTDRPAAGEGDDDRRRAHTAALTAFVDYLRGLVESRRDNLSDDLVSQLITLEEEGERLNDKELIAVMIEVITGGHDTTANSIVNGVFMLLRYPEQLERLVENCSLVSSAVEEILRHRTPVQLTLTRVTTEDVTIEGVTIPARSTVVVCLSGANREPERFADPDTFDIGREDHRHLTFGNGSHFCLGAHLARAELQVTFDRIATRLPGLHMTADVEALPWRTSALVTAPARLPVAW